MLFRDAVDRKLRLGAERFDALRLRAGRVPAPQIAQRALHILVDQPDILPPDQVATFPLAVGLAVLRGLSPFLPATARRALKWPNDVLVEGRKIAGILCERQGEMVIAGIGINVNQQKFAESIENRAISLALLGSVPTVDAVRAAVLSALAEVYGVWRDEGFGAVYPEIAAYDGLRGQTLAVRQTDDDRAPLTGLCGGIQPDGSLRIGETCVYAGEAHVVQM